jgi:8-oxo-dGTP pyrophosphatase MutT (NUDIX family)
MPQPKPWTTLSSRTVIDNLWLKVRADSCLNADGRVIDPYFVIEAPDFVHVAAITPDESLVMVRQYRQGSQAVHLELPAGMIDMADRSPLQAGQRELREETGFAADQWHVIANWWSNPARQNTRHHLLLATDARQIGQPMLDDAESLVVELVPMLDLPALVRTGGIDGAQHVAAILRILMDWRPAAGFSQRSDGASL